LHLHWGEALDQLGERARAAQEYRYAQQLGLSDADKQITAHRLTAAVP
jgi:hypothetical protein